jgi:hypothetical protein
MKVNYPGLIRQVLPSGTVVYRVRPKGQHGKRIQISGIPGSEEFSRQYTLARRGVKPDPAKKPSEEAIPQSIGWLVHTYLEYLEERVKAGNTSAKTVKKKRNLLAKLIADPDRKMQVPREKLIEIQDKMAASPAQADAFIEAVAVLFDWAIDRKYLKENTARGIKSVYRKGDGAKPWKAADVTAFFAKHKTVTTPHVAMSVLLWTGCRIEDLTILGREHECVIDGIEALRWVPLKKGSTEVFIPLLDPLKAAVRAPKVLATTYVAKRGGIPMPAVTRCLPCSSAGARMQVSGTCLRTGCERAWRRCWLRWGVRNTTSWPSWAIPRQKPARFTPAASSAGT